MAKTTISLERLLWRFHNERGLYLLGAGASAGIVKIGADLMAAPGIEYVNNVMAFSAASPQQSLLTKRVVTNAERALRRDRYRRPFVVPDFAMDKEMLRRLPPDFAELFLVNEFARPRYDGRIDVQRRHCNYSIFDFFEPSLIMNYNLDGLATDVCGRRHDVVGVHGSVDPVFGSPEVSALMPNVRDFGIGFGAEFNDLLLCVPEPDFGHPGFWPLCRRLDRMWRHIPNFVAIIGYTFASADRTGEEHDDYISLDHFTERFRDSPQTIYIVNPTPDPVRERLEERLKSNNIVSVPTRWNALSRVAMERIVTRSGGRLERAVGELLDKYDDRAFLTSERR